MSAVNQTRVSDVTAAVSGSRPARLQGARLVEVAGVPCVRVCRTRDARVLPHVGLELPRRALGTRQVTQLVVANIAQAVTLAVGALGAHRVAHALDAGDSANLALKVARDTLRARARIDSAHASDGAFVSGKAQALRCKRALLGAAGVHRAIHARVVAVIRAVVQIIQVFELALGAAQALPSSQLVSAQVPCKACVAGTVSGAVALRRRVGVGRARDARFRAHVGLEMTGGAVAA